MKRLLTVFILLFITVQSNAANYYFSAKGKDSNSGMRSNAPWKSLSKLAGLKLNPGDSILLKRGEYFEGALELTYSGSVNKPIVIAAYGKGNKPVLTGAKQVSKWTNNSGVFVADFDGKVTDLYVNNARQTIARYPNKGFLTLDSGQNKKVIFSQAIKNIPGNIAGAFVRLRSIDWAYETRLAQSATPNSITLVYHDQYKEEKAWTHRTANGTTTIYNLNKGYGFYVDGLPQFVDTAKEWSSTGKQVYLKPQAASSIKGKIEAAVETNGIRMAPGISNVKIENIQIEKYYFAAVNIGIEAKNVSINNCKIKDINVYGILMDSLSTNCRITNNSVTNILGKGISILEPEKMLIENNEVKNIGLVPGQGYSGVNGASGIGIVNNESQTYKKSRYANNNLVRLNKVDSCGYNGIRVDGNYNTVEYNIISNCGLTLNDGSSLYCYAQQTEITHHQIFRRNIVKNSKGNNEGTPANSIHFNGIYIDNNCHDMLIEENTSMDNSSSGLMNNAGSYSNTFNGNNVFNCGTAMGMYEWSRPNMIYGIKISNNT
ncbi:MAG TPA: right-handed parallel beta-helix repeat-containing protein, partial [Pedobacter sp.]